MPAGIPSTYTNSDPRSPQDDTRGKHPSLIPCFSLFFISLPMHPLAHSILCRNNRSQPIMRTSAHLPHPLTGEILVVITGSWRLSEDTISCWLVWFLSCLWKLPLRDVLARQALWILRTYMFILTSIVYPLERQLFKFLAMTSLHLFWWSSFPSIFAPL